MVGQGRGGEEKQEEGRGREAGEGKEGKWRKEGEERGEEEMQAVGSNTQ